MPATGGHNFKGEVPQADQLATVAAQNDIEMIVLSSGVVQGDLVESIHRNAFGQQALGNCPEQIHAQDSGSWGCTNAAGQSNSSMTVAPV